MNHIISIACLTVALLCLAMSVDAAEQPNLSAHADQRSEKVRAYLRDHPEAKERLRAWMAEHPDAQGHVREWLTEHPEAREQLREKIRERMARHPQRGAGQVEHGQRTRDS